MIIPKWALSSRELWTPTLVRRALVRALVVERAVPARIGPNGDRAYWPETLSEPGEEVEDERLHPDKDDITRMEYVRLGYPDENGIKRPGWLNGPLLGYPGQRRILERWATWASFGKRARDGVSQTEEEFARELHMSESTLLRQRDFAAGIIAGTLNEHGLPVWHAEGPPKRKNRAVATSAGA